jgi:hypothetical protein
MAQLMHLFRQNEENHKNNGTASLLTEILRMDLLQLHSSNTHHYTTKVEEYWVCSYKAQHIPSLGLYEGKYI